MIVCSPNKFIRVKTNQGSTYTNRRTITGRLIVKAQVNTTRVSSQFDSNWLKADPTVLALSFFGWTVPSSIPVSGFGGDSLFSKFTSSIGDELAHFPTGPALNSDFWIYFALYHIGLFLCMLLGQIGVQGRKQGYFQ